jgi:acylphosphatase
MKGDWRMSDHMIRKEIRISGRVQGVGFRYRAKYAASGLGVSGWVKNEWDGSVLMEVQGTERQINEMLTIINQSHYISIDDLEYHEIPLVKYEHGFRVMY